MSTIRQDLTIRTPHQFKSDRLQEGEIHLTLLQGARAGERLRIASTRAQIAQRLLAGQTPAQAVARVGLAYALCGQAQRCACEAATAAAAGDVTPAPAAQRRILAELAREHVWYLTSADGAARPDPAAWLEIARAGEDSGQLAQVLSRLLQERLLGESVETWLKRDPHGLVSWAHRTPTAPARALAVMLAEGGMGVAHTPLLPSLGQLTDSEVRDLALQALDAPAFCQQPLWRGAPAETGALARMRVEPPLVEWGRMKGRDPALRLLARLTELARLPEWLQGAPPTVLRAWRLDAGLGAAGVETARGLLLHIVRLREGRVADYRILAPTEWNFHPQGVLAEAMQALAWDAGTIARVERLIRSLDPCVAFRVEVAQDA